MDLKNGNELTFKLPEIHFSDDDEDEASSTCESKIQIFSRPTLGNEESGDLDVSFLDESSSQDWLAETIDAALGEANDMGLDFPEPASDISAGFWSTKLSSLEKPAATKSTSSGTQSASDGSTVPKLYASAGTSTVPASALKDSSLAGIKKSAKTETKADSTNGDWTPLKLGDVGDLELSKALDQLRLPAAPLTIDTIEPDAEPDTQRNEELLRQLSQHSLQFSGSRQEKLHPKASTVPQSASPSSKSTSAFTTKSSNGGAAAAVAGLESLTDRALQAMEASARRQTVRVDLRHSQAAALQLSDLLRFGPPLGEQSVASKEAATSADDIRESSSEDDEAEPGGGLWLDSYRRAKKAGGPNNSASLTKTTLKTTANAGTKTTPTPTRDEDASDKDSNLSTQSAPKVNGLPKPTAVKQQTAGTDLKEDSATLDNDAQKTAPTLSPAAELEKKLEAMRQREAELSWRRSLLNALREIAPHLLAVSLEPIAHDDVTFTEPPMESLDPRHRQSENLLLIEARLNPCGQLLGLDGWPLDIADTARDASYHCLLAWLISLAGNQPKPRDPLHVLGLRQLADSSSGSASQAGNLRLQVAAHANSQVPLHRYLADVTLHQACSAWLSAEHSADLFVSRRPLSALLSVSRSADGRAISDDRLSMFWWPLRREPSGLAEHWPPCSLPMEASVLELDRDAAVSQPGRLLQLLRAVASAGCDLAGIRLAYSSSATAKTDAALVMAVRGCGAVAAMRTVAASVCAGFQGRRDAWSVSRYVESVPRDLSRYFGGRLSPKTTPSQVRALAPDREDPSGVARLLTAAPLEDVAMLASPLVTEIGWLLHLAGESGFALIGCRRVQLHREELASQLGMADSQAACFAGGVACVLLLRRENALHHAGAFIQTVVSEIKSRRQLNAPPSLLFFAMPYLAAVLQTVHCTRIDSLPKLKSDAHRVEEPCFPDQEQLAALIISGRNFQAIAAQLLDQLADLELLGLKCLPRLPQLHAHFVAEQLLGADGGGEWRAAKPLMELPALVFTVRGVVLMRRLDEIAPHYPACSDYRLLRTTSWHQAYCLTRNLFADFELFECPERRPCLLTCPPTSPQSSDTLSAATTVLSQLRHPGPDRVASHSYLLLSSNASSSDDQHWHLRAVARAARLVARDSFELDWLGLVQQPDERLVCIFRLRRENAVAALASQRSALVETLPTRVGASLPSNWKEVGDVEQRLGIDALMTADVAVAPNHHRYSANPSPPPTATAAGDCTGLLWRLPADSLHLLARLCDLLHRRGVRLIGLSCLRLDSVPLAKCVSLGRELRLRRLEHAGGEDLQQQQQQKSQLDAAGVLNNRNELIPGTYLVFILEGNLVSLGLQGYLTESATPDATGLLPQLGHPPAVYQTDGATAGALQVANRLQLALLPSDLIVDQDADLTDD